MPYFTIVIPVYRAQKYIRQCVDSIINQSFKDFEVILVDDGSPDACPQICEEYVQKDLRFSVIHKKNEGSQKARKTGVQKAKGTYVAFMDADDWVDDGWLEFAFQQLEQFRTDIIAFGYKQEIAGKSIQFENAIKPGKYSGSRFQKEVLPYVLSTEKFGEFGIWPSLWSKIIKKELILKIMECVDEQLTLGEDAACTYLCMRNAESLYVCDAAFYHYRYVPDSLAQRYNPLFWENTERLFCFLDSIQKDNNDKQVERYKMYILLTGLRKEFLYLPDIIQARQRMEEVCSRGNLARVIQEFEDTGLHKTEKFIVDALKKKEYGRLQSYFGLQRRKNKIKRIIKGILYREKRKYSG